MLVMMIITFSQGFVICSCDAGHINVEPVVHSSCHHEHSHDHHHNTMGHDHLDGPIDGITISGQRSDCSCENCVDVPLDSSDFLPLSSFDLSAYFAVLAEYVHISKESEILSSCDINFTNEALSFFFPLNTIVMRN